MENRFFVAYSRHNKDTDGWAYKVEMSSTNYDEALSKYFALLSEVVGSKVFDYIAIQIYDVENNQLKKDVYDKNAFITVE